MADLTIVKSEPLKDTGELRIVSSKPEERSFSDAVANAGEKFWDWTGRPVAMALGLSSGTDKERGEKARAAQSQIVNGILNEPARVRQELTNALDSFVAGNPRATLHHVLTATPIVGEGINQAAQEFAKGDTSSGVGHMAAVLAPAAIKESGPIARGGGAVVDAAKDVVSSYLPKKSPATEPVASTPLLHKVGRYVAGKVIPGGGLAYDVVKDVVGRKAETPVEPVVPKTPGQVFAEQTGTDWDKLRPQDREMLEKIAAGQQNAANPGPGIQRPAQASPEVPPVAEPPATPSLSIAEQIAAEIKAKKAAEPPAPEPVAVPKAAKVKPQPPVKLPEGYQRVATPVGTTGTPTGALPVVRNAPVEPAAPTTPPVEAVAPQVAPEQIPAVQPTAQPPLAPEEAGPPHYQSMMRENGGVWNADEHVWDFSNKPHPPIPAQPPEAPQSAPQEVPEVTPAPAKPFAEMTKPELIKALGLPDNPSPTDIAKALYEEAQRSGTAVQPKESPEVDPTALAEAARTTPQMYRKTAAKANYRAVKEGKAEPNTASPTYEAMNRAVKVHPVVQALLDNGVGYDDMAKLTKPEIESYVNQLSAATRGEHPGNVFSQLSIDELLGELRRAQTPPPEKYAGGDMQYAGKVSKGRAMRNNALKKENK